MKSVSAKAMEALPTAIWIPVNGMDPVFYRGSPLEMVQEMASDMKEVDLHVAVKKILAGLAEHRRVTIQFPEGLPDEALSRLFVYALLATGIGRPMPLA